jgi:hypothetical protein
VNGPRACRWLLLALLVAAAVAAASGAGAGTAADAGGQGVVAPAPVAAGATLGAAAAQAALVPARPQDAQSTLTRDLPGPEPLAGALLAALAAALPVGARRRRLSLAGPASALVALRRAVALRAPPAFRPA